MNDSTITPTIVKAFFLITSVIVALLAFLCVYLYLKIVKVRVQSQIEKEKYLEQIKQQEQEFAERDVNIYRAPKTDINSEEADKSRESNNSSSKTTTTN